MARTLIAPQTPGATGTVPTYAAADGTNGMSFYNTGTSILHIKNGGGASINVTLTTGGGQDGLTFPNQVIAIPATSEKMISLRHTTLYTQADGTTWVDFSASASVTVGVFVGGAA